MASFKVGDRVRVTNVGEDRSHPKIGKVGEITMPAVGYDWRLVFEDGLTLAVEESEIELAEPRKDSPRAGDTVRVVLEGKVTSIAYGETAIRVGDGGFANLVSRDADHVKSIEIIEKAKPSVKGLALRSVVKAAGSVYQKYGADEWSTMGEEYSTPDADIDEMGWTLLVEQSNG